MRWMGMRFALFRLLTGCTVLAASCGERGDRLPETGASLEGTITYGGQKVMFAVVTVAGTDSMAFGDVKEDGRYRVENVPLGEVSIGVNTDAAKGEFVSKTMAESKGKGKTRLRFVGVPPKYFEPETSGLKTTIQKGVNTYDIVIPK